MKQRLGFGRKRGMSLFYLCALCSLLLGLQVEFARADVAVFLATTANGGSTISADTAANGGSGAFGALLGPALEEMAAGDVGLGTITLTAPAGFQFRVSLPVTVSVQAVSNEQGSGVCTSSVGLKLSVPGQGQLLQAVSLSASASSVTVQVTQTSVAGTRCRVQWSGLGLRPLNGSPLSAGAITLDASSSASLANAPAGTSFGVFSTSGGTPDAAVSRVEVFPDRMPADGVTQATVAVFVKDRFGNPLPGVNVTLSSTTGLGTILNPVLPTGVAGRASGLITAPPALNAGQTTIRAVLDGSLTLVQQPPVTFVAKLLAVAIRELNNHAAITTNDLKEGFLSLPGAFEVFVNASVNFSTSVSQLFPSVNGVQSPAIDPRALGLRFNASNGGGASAVVVNFSNFLQTFDVSSAFSGVAGAGLAGPDQEKSVVDATVNLGRLGVLNINDTVELRVQVLLFGI